ncbi:MAG: nucleotidyltransferase domain-containing protein [Euryarchaeota archaeon]|nr:nucleotidyltransferase domain-containing protein [Euryarchaeota archaeon]
MPNEILKNQIIHKIKNFLYNRDEITFAYLFGSISENNKFNDVDLAIYANKEVDKWYDIKLSRELEKEIKFPVDIVFLNKASDSLTYRASKGILIKNTDDDFRVNFITKVWKKYFDFRPKLYEFAKEATT